MDNVSLADWLAQAEDSEVGEAFDSFMHTAARMAFTAVLFNEVETLCGKAYHPEESRKGVRRKGVSVDIRTFSLVDPDAFV